MIFQKLFAWTANARPQNSSAGPALLRCFRFVCPALCFVWISFSVSAADILTPELLQKASQEVLQQLRDGKVEAAWQSLEPVGESGLQMDAASSFPLAHATAALHQAVGQLPGDGQYDLLKKWTITTTPQVRHFVTLVPTDAPPIEFARALGDRPRPGFFPIASVGTTRGIFSSGWLLVSAARDSGKLARLIADLTPLAEKKVPGSESLLLLARLIDERADAGQLDAALVERITAASAPKEDKSGRIEAADLVVAIAASQHAKLCDRGEQLLAAMVTANGDLPSPSVRAFLRIAHAQAVMRSEAHSANTPVEKSEVAAALKPRFKHWIPVSTTATPTVSAGLSDSIWLAQEDQFFHLAGSGTDTLICKYPLSGEFQFQCEAQTGGSGKVESGLVMDGWRLQLTGPEFRILDDNGRVIKAQSCWFAENGAPLNITFNRLSFTAMASDTRLEINRHPLYTGTRVQRASPWLGLSARADSRQLFRNLTWTGDPTIPRQVELVGEQADAAWQVRGGDDWQFTKETIESSVPANAAPPRGPSLLSYFRPLLDGESVAYEFFQEPGKHAVHPAFGRLAFLLRPDGVRVRWVTSPNEWTLLPPDNAVAEPLNRRGPRALPLKSGDWNQLIVSRTDKGISLKLNDELIYQRPVDWTGDQRFGLYRGEEDVGVRVRKISLTGPWPEKLPEELRETPALLVDDQPRLIERRAGNRLIQDEYLASNVQAVRRRALSMPLEERFRYLSQWVLPGPDHGFRVTGYFTQTNPAPPVQEPGTEFSERGAEIITPVYDWLDAARQLGRLEECLKSVKDAPRPPVEQSYEERSRLAITLLLGLELGVWETQTEEWNRFFALIAPMIPTNYAEQWPETIVGVRAAARFPGNELVRSLVVKLIELRVNKWRPDGMEQWHHHWSSLHRRVVNWPKDEAARKRGDPNADRQLHQWLAVDASRANTHGRGFPAVHFERRDNVIIKSGYHDNDFAFFQLPLAGDFQFESEMTQGDGESPQVMIGHIFTGVVWDLKSFQIGNFRGILNKPTLDPPLQGNGKPSRFRANVTGDKCIVYLNGRRVHEHNLPTPRDPWIGIRCWGRLPNYAKNVTFTGHPTVLESVSLEGADASMSNWLNYHHDNTWTTVNVPQEMAPANATVERILASALQQKPEPRWIVGQPDPNLAGTYRESLLRYPRRLIEDGQIEFEFYYEPGKFEVHPALDRLAFMITPDGIQEHWITDGEFDRTGMPPDNLTKVTANHRGPDLLPLKSAEWNRLVLKLNGHTAQVELNGELVYEREIEPGNLRSFGLFHYLDATTARVRNASMRGDWPKVLPSLSEQELADPQIAAIDAGRSKLNAVFHYSFAGPASSSNPGDGMIKVLRQSKAQRESNPRISVNPEKFFQFPTSNQRGTMTQKGFRVTHQAIGKTGLGTEIHLRFSLSGDFDVEAKFSDWQATGKQHDSGCCLRVVLDQPGQNIYDLSRILSRGTTNLSQATRHLAQPGRSERAWIGEPFCVEATSGRFRIARRGDQLHWLLAENDSPTFHLLLTDTVSKRDVEGNDIRLHSFTTDGTTQHIWNSITLRAEKLSWYRTPEPATRWIKIVDTKGKLLASVPTPEALRPYYFGSPEWSADGKLICADVWRGSGSSSRILIMNSDGTNVRDLAAGAMPSFSPDAKQIAYCISGIKIMNIDGSDVETVDTAGWGTQWSPDGKYIAYGKAGNVWIWDTKTKQSRPVMKGAAAEKYGRIVHNLCWSHDSKFVSFKAFLKDNVQIDLAVADITTGECQVLTDKGAPFSDEITFSPDNRQVLAGYTAPGAKHSRVYVFDRLTPGPPQLLPNQLENHHSFSGIWSPDGQRLIILCDELPAPVEWTPELTAENGVGLPPESK